MPELLTAIYNTVAMFLFLFGTTAYCVVCKYYEDPDEFPNMHLNSDELEGFLFTSFLISVTGLGMLIRSCLKLSQGLMMSM